MGVQLAVESIDAPVSRDLAQAVTTTVVRELDEPFLAEALTGSLPGPFDVRAVVGRVDGEMVGTSWFGRRRTLPDVAVMGDGFFEVFEAADLLEADRIARSDPLVEAGLGSWMIRELEHLE